MDRFKGLLFFTCLVTAASGQTFNNPRAIHVDGPSPVVSVADMNNDGMPDLIVQTGDSVTPSAVQILLADAAGNFTSSTPVTSTLLFPYPCMPGDINGDGKTDVICAGGSPASRDVNVMVYLGNGDGTLQAAIATSLGQIWTPGTQPDVLAVADVDKDGHPDLIVTTGAAGSWANYNFTLLGDGTGHFSVKPFAGSIPQGPATVADVNGDGIPDLLIGYGPDIYLGNGDGTFTGTYPYQYVVGNCIFADFERTGRLSAGCVTFNGNLQVLHENGDGTLNTSAPITNVSLPPGVPLLAPLKAVDLNGDGILDIAMSSKDGLEVMLGGPGLSFSGPVPYSAGSADWANATTGSFTDMDGDGHPDFITTGAGSVYISYGRGDGSLEAPVLSRSGTSLYTAKTADFDGDGIADVVTLGVPGINFLHGKGDGTFAAPVPLTLPSGYSVPSGGLTAGDLLLGDFNGDGRKDFLIPAGLFSDNLLFLGNGDGTFAPGMVVPASTLPGTATLTSGSVVADINGDGKDDIVQVTRASPTATTNVYLSQGDGTFRLVTSSFANASGQNTAIAFADFNGDHVLDAVVFFADHAIVLTGHGDGSFSSTATTLTVAPVSGTSLMANVVPVLAVGDFDGDGHADVALMGQYDNYAPDLYLSGSTVRYSNAIWVYYGNGDSTFSQAVSAGVFYDYYPFSLTAAALHPGAPSDLITWNSGSLDAPFAAPLALIPSLPGRTFGDPRFLAGGFGIDSVQVADFNGDGKPDLFTSNGAWYPAGEGANSFAVLLNQPVRVSGSLVTSPQPSLAGQSYTARAELVPFQSQLGDMTGELNFSVDGTPIAPASLSGDIASDTVTANLTGGDHTITASWAGDDTFGPVSLSTVQHIMDYSLTADASATIQSGHQGTIGVHLASIDGFADTVSLSCGNLPTYAACTFSQPTTGLSAGQTVSVQLTLSTSSSTSAENSLAKGSLPLSLAIVVPGMLILMRRRPRTALFFLVPACMFLIGPSGCGGGGGSGGSGGGKPNPPPTAPPSTAAGAYNITITAVGSNTHLQHTANVTVTVTQ